MKKYTIVVADDESLTRERIVALLKNYAQFSVVAEAANGAKTIYAIKKHQPDVVFLDIKMPILNGFEVLQKLDSDDYGILVFITAYDQYAIKAFENEALDYLLKPFDNQRFDKLMNRLTKHLKKTFQLAEHYILVKENNEVLKINTRDIIYAKAENNYVQIHLDHQVYRKRCALAAFSGQLDNHFFRIHRSYIINAEKILKMKHIGHGDYFFSMSNGKSIPSSKSYREVVKCLIK